jgi:hypothetical protein
VENEKLAGSAQRVALVERPFSPQRDAAANLGVFLPQILVGCTRHRANGGVH